MSRTSNQVTRPSGLRQSANGQYIYANCVVTGKPTFFKPDYFALVLNRDFAGDEVKMAKGYVCKDVKKLRKAGKTDAQIVALLGKFDPKAPKPIKAEVVVVAEVVKPKKVKTVEAVVEAVVPAPVVTKEPITVKPVVKVVYPWSDNPGYFLGNIGVLNYEEATKETCFHPTIHLDEQCEGCPILDKCTCGLKISDEARAKLASRGKVVPVTKKIDLVKGCFDEVVVSQ